MKRTILIVIFLGITFSLSTVCAVKLLSYAYSVHNSVHNSLTSNDLIVEAWEELYHKVYLPFGILSLIAALCTFAAMIIIAIKDFPCFKPLIDKLQAKRAARKEQRDIAKAEQAEADKQARIERLQAELDELKKDE